MSDDTREAYRIGPAEAETAREQRRLEALGRARDPGTRAVLAGVGLAPGWRCLEVGGGAGSISRWLAEQVGPHGEVLSTDVDLRFQGRSEGVLEVRRHDIVSDPLPADFYDLVHARAVLQHLPRREEALARMVAAARPGGWVVVEDADWSTMENDGVPEPFATLTSKAVELATVFNGWDRYFGRRLLGLFRAHGLEAVEATGHVWTMHGGTDSAEWYVAAMELAGERLVAAGLLDAETVARAITQGRAPDFAILSPVGLSVRGRKPLR